MIASSNRLWEFYFHLLSNNRNGKTKVATEIINKDPRFWKDKIRDNFTSGNCRTSKRINFFNSERKNEIRKSFPDQFSAQVVKMILSRIYLDSLYVKGDSGIFENINSIDDEDIYYDDKNYKMIVKISGIEGNVILRWCVSDNCGLFAYRYSKTFYWYFAMEKDDKLLNEKEFFIKQNNLIDLENLGKSGRAFIYKFNGKSNPGSVYGKDYLTREILDYLVPTVKSYKLSPTEFIPYWSFLFDLIIYSGCKHKEIYKHYPDIISNPLIHKYFANQYLARAKAICNSIRNDFKDFRSANETERKLLEAIVNNQADSIEFNSTNRDELMNGIRKLFILFSRRPEQFPRLPSIAFYNDQEEFENKLLYSASTYRMCNNLDEYLEWYLEKKLKRPFQMVNSSDSGG